GNRCRWHRGSGWRPCLRSPVGWITSYAGVAWRGTNSVRVACGEGWMTPETSRRWQWLAIAVVVAFLVWLLSPVLMPFVLGAMLAYLCSPLVDHLQRWKMART